MQQNDKLRLQEEKKLEEHLPVFWIGVIFVMIIFFALMLVYGGSSADRLWKVYFNACKIDIGVGTHVLPASFDLTLHYPGHIENLTYHEVCS